MKSAPNFTQYPTIAVSTDAEWPFVLELTVVTSSCYFCSLLVIGLLLVVRYLLIGYCSVTFGLCVAVVLCVCHLSVLCSSCN